MGRHPEPSGNAHPAKPGDRREPETTIPHSRARRIDMRKVLAPACFISLILSLSAFCFSAQRLEVKVLAPDSAPVSGAQLTVYRVDSNKPLATTSTNAQGAAAFSGLPDGDLRIEVLAPGFGKKVVAVNQSAGVLSVQLQ